MVEWPGPVGPGTPGGSVAVGTTARAVKAGVLDVYGELLSFVWMNLLWVALSAPLIALLWLVALTLGSADALDAGGWRALGLVFFAAVGPNPALAGTHWYANRLARGELLEPPLVLDGLLEHGRPALLLFALGFGGFLVLGSNVAFYAARYAESRSPWLLGIAILWGWTVALWALVQPYLLPLLVEHQDRRILLVVRNALLLAIGHPATSVALLVVLATLFVVSALVPPILLLVAGSLSVTIQQRATLALLDKHRPPLQGGGEDAGTLGEPGTRDSE